MSGFMEFPDTRLVRPRKRAYHAYIQDKPDNDGKEDDCKLEHTGTANCTVQSRMMEKQQRTYKKT